jgi:hypothetical protein
MRRIHAEVNYGYVGSEREKYFEFDDDITDGEIADEVWDWACERVEVSWREEEERAVIKYE